MTAMPAPRIIKDLPIPALAGQSPGRGETIALGGGGGGWGFGAPGAADEEPQLTATLLIPRAIIVRSIAVLPTA